MLHVVTFLVNNKICVHCRVDAAAIEDPVLRAMRKKDKYAAQPDDFLSRGHAAEVDSPPRNSCSVSDL